MADGTHMKQMEAQLQQVTAAVSDMQIWMGGIESTIEVVVERRIEGATDRWREESRE